MHQTSKNSHMKICTWNSQGNPLNDAIKLNILNHLLSNSSELSLHIVGGYGILAIPSKLAVQSWQSGYGRDAIPSYRLLFIYKDKYEYLLNNRTM